MSLPLLYPQPPPIDIDIMSSLVGPGVSLCLSNCSGHGDCLNGTCFCEIQFAGNECGGSNVNYHIGLASTYLFVALVSFTQLLISIIKSAQQKSLDNPHSSHSHSGSGYLRSRSGSTSTSSSTGTTSSSSSSAPRPNANYKLVAITPSSRFRQALCPTTPKAIYCVVFLAASLRAAYFAVSASWAADWLLSLLSAYYPLLLTGSSLIVCFWAERFHLRNVRDEFLSKSFLGFISFNILTYSILLMQTLLVLANRNQEERSYYLRIFNGCYAVLLLIVVIFFLIYGVEVYFKVRGGFVLLSSDSSYPPQGYSNSSDNRTTPDSFGLVSGPGDTATLPPVDISQLNQSRLGLISQASMLLVTCLFILSDVAGEWWKDKVRVESRNTLDLVFRIVEVGVALWFPCVLWNVQRPDQLWILNPTKLLKSPTPAEDSDDAGSYCSNDDLVEDQLQLDEKCGLSGGSDSVGCYFCYDPDRLDAGPIIQPCECRGDVASVHHECLRKWLLQKASESGEACCSVCKTPYKLEGLEDSLRWSACSDVSAAHWLKFCLMVAAISGIFMSSWALCHVLPSPAYKLLVLGFALVGLYVILKFLGQNTFAAYQQAKVSSVKIISRSKEGAPGSGSQTTTTSIPTSRILILETKI